MTDVTIPQTGTVENSPTSFTLREGADAIESLLSDDLLGDTKGTDGPKKPAEGQEIKEPETVTEDDEPELVIDDDDETELTEAKPEPTAVDDNYEVEIDGGKIPLGELKKGYLRQSDYSKKTDAVARERETVQAEAQRIRSEVENEFRQRVEFINQYATKFIPQKPVYDPADPIGYLEAQQVYEQQMQEWSQIEQLNSQEQAQRSERQKQEHSQYQANQRSELVKRIPALKNDDKRKAFIEDLGKIAINEYGITEEEIPLIDDARYMHVLHDAIQYRKALARAKETKPQLSTKPKLDTRQRMNVSQAQGRDKHGRFEELRKDRSINAAARSIEDLLD